MTTNHIVETRKVQVLEGELTDTEFEWTQNKFIDELVHELGTTGTQLDNDGKITTARPYIDQVRELMYRIPLWQPAPPFIIHYSWLSEGMKKQYNDFKKFSTKHEFEQVLLDSVGRLFENENSKYYHNSIKKLLRVKVTR